MKWIAAIAAATLMTVLLIASLTCIALPILRPPQGLSGGKEIELIDNQHPFYLVDPRTLKVPDDEVVAAWVRAEVKARIIATCLLFGLATGVLVVTSFTLGERKQRTSGLRRWEH